MTTPAAIVIVIRIILFDLNVIKTSLFVIEEHIQGTSNFVILLKKSYGQPLQ